MPDGNGNLDVLIDCYAAMNRYMTSGYIFKKTRSVPAWLAAGRNGHIVLGSKTNQI
jgi:hypothetical protein